MNISNTILTIEQAIIMQQKNLESADKIYSIIKRIIKFLLKTSAWIILVYIILVTFGNYVLSKTIMPWLPYTTSTTSMEPVEIILVNGYYRDIEHWYGKEKDVLVPDENSPRIKFVLSKSYLTWKDEIKGGEMDDFSIEATYPDFKPWAAEEVKNKKLGNDEKIYIKVDMNRKLFPIERKYIHDFIYINQFMYGLKHYLVSSELKLVDNVMIKDPLEDDFFIPDDISNDVFGYISCPSFLWNKNVLCTAEVNFSEHLSGEYTFVRKDIAHWREIDAKVREFVESLIIKDDKCQEQFFKINSNQ